MPSLIREMNYFKWHSYCHSIARKKKDIMKNKNTQLLLVITLFVFTNLFSQIKEKVIVTDADFDKEIKKNTYYPLVPREKKVAWKNTFYIENVKGTKTFNNKEYTLCKQKWESGRTKKIYLREENGVVFEYEDCCGDESIVLDAHFNKGKTWESADKKIKYKLITFFGKLKTPYGEYENLLVIRKIHARKIYEYYYKKGYGYIGATKQGTLFSYVIPTKKNKIK